MLALAENETSTWNERERKEELASLSSEDIEFLRDAATNSLYILSKGILGYPDVNPGVHKDFCEAISRSEKKRRLWLMPRAHLKSTIKTIAHPIQLVLQDPEYTRVLINSETATQAQKFLSEIKHHWEKNELLRALFPELVPERLTGPGSDWSQARATLRREAVHREAHWQAIGVGGAITGGHFSHINNDDLIGLEAYRSPAKMQMTKDWNDTIEPLLINQHRDFIDWVGTRWGPNDLYQHVMTFYGDDISVYTRSAIENGEIIFPELHTWEEYERLQTQNPALWFSQYENNPIAGGAQDLAFDAIQPYYLTPDYQEVVKKLPDGSEERWQVSQLDRVITVDPNSGSPVAPDMAAIMVVAQAPNEDIFTLENWSDRSNPDQFVKKIFSLARKWRPRLVGIEKAGQQNTLFYFEKLCREEQFHVRTVPLEPKGRDKEERIRYYTQPTIASGKLHMLPSQTILRQQIKDFPNNLLVDELDAFAYAFELLVKPSKAESRLRSHGVLRRLLHTRNHRTGY
jgi:hypothetical protein